MNFVKLWKVCAGFGIMFCASFLMTVSSMPLHPITKIFCVSSVFSMSAATFFLLANGERKK